MRVRLVFYRRPWIFLNQRGAREMERAVCLPASRFRTGLRSVPLTRCGHFDDLVFVSVRVVSNQDLVGTVMMDVAGRIARGIEPGGDGGDIRHTEYDFGVGISVLNRQ